MIKSVTTHIKINLLLKQYQNLNCQHFDTIAKFVIVKVNMKILNYALVWYWLLPDGRSRVRDRKKMNLIYLLVNIEVTGFNPKIGFAHALTNGKE